MTTKTTTLTDRIAYLISGNEKRYRRLERGLCLAYTPANLNNGRFRLTCSRYNAEPSAQEVEIVKRDLKVVLREKERPWAEMEVGQVVKRGRWRYRVIEWKEYQQGRLI